MTPQFLTLQKAITDEALWSAMAAAKDDKPDWKKLQDRSLASQEINPVYTGLADRLSQVEIEVNALLPRAARLAQDLGTMSDEIKAKDSPLRLDEAGLEKLKREREAGLDRIKEDRGNGLAALMRQRQLEERDQTGAGRQGGPAPPRRQSREGPVRGLAKNYNQALLAKAQQDVEDIRLGAAAVPPDSPLPRGTLTKALLAMLLAGIVATLIAIVRDAMPMRGGLVTPRPNTRGSARSCWDSFPRGWGVAIVTAIDVEFVLRDIHP